MERFTVKPKTEIERPICHMEDVLDRAPLSDSMIVSEFAYHIVSCLPPDLDRHHDACGAHVPGDDAHALLYEF